MRFLFILFLVLSVVHTSNAQGKKYVRQNKQWFQYYNTVKLSKKWVLKSDVGFRWQNSFREYSQFIIRAGLGYKIAPGSRILLGMSHLGFYTNSKIFRLEYRPYQELVMNDYLSRLKLQHRIRVEERFFKQLDDNRNSFNLRFRYRFMTELRLKKWLQKNEFSITLGDELFINAGKSITNNIFGQNRLLLGALYRYNKKISVQLTYNKEIASTSRAGEYFNNNILWLSLRQNLQLRGRK